MRAEKDRYTVLSEKMIDQLKRYLEGYQPAYWLFEGQEGGGNTVLPVFEKCFAARLSVPGSTLILPYIRCGTALPRICWNRDRGGLALGSGPAIHTDTDRPQQQ